jgi:hypothetical protein
MGGGGGEQDEDYVYSPDHLRKPENLAVNLDLVRERDDPERLARLAEAAKTAEALAEIKQFQAEAKLAGHELSVTARARRVACELALVPRVLVP